MTAHFTVRLWDTSFQAWTLPLNRRRDCEKCTNRGGKAFYQVYKTLCIHRVLSTNYIYKYEQFGNICMSRVN